MIIVMYQNSCQEEKIIIRKNRLFRNLRLSINKNGHIILSIPFFCSRRQALAFLEQHRDWIREQQNKLPKKLTFQDGQRLSILGRQLTITHSPHDKCGVRTEGERLIVCGESDFINRRVTDFIKRETATYINRKAPELARQIDVSFSGIHLKDTTSRWGSCSSKGNLNFCWRLGMAPLFVLDYIIAHEVAHLKEMNHSHRFWSVVAQLTDRRSEAEIWLHRHGQELR